MDPYGKNELLTFYDRHLRDFGDHPQAVRWTPEGQRARYEAFLGIIDDVSGKTLLDFGCGKGDLHGFLRERGVTARYCGMDVNENLIALARRKYPEAEFIALDVEEEGLDRRFDVIVACGVFNLRIGGIHESMLNTVRVLFGACREALHLNLLTWQTAVRDVELHYVKPEEILAFAIGELSPLVTLRHDLVPGDLFLSVLRRRP